VKRRTIAAVLLLVLTLQGPILAYAPGAYALQQYA